MYQRLGTDTPHVAPKSVKEEEDDEESEREPQAPLSPTELKAEETQPTIAVRGSENSDSSAVKQSDEETPKSRAISQSTLQNAISDKKKPPGKKRRASARVYRELFEATLRMNDGPMVWEVKDLRNVGGDKSWNEPANCLVCGTTIE
jgi:hypothetical protein